ncbi:MAG: hypothetical protein H7095_07330 [Pseudopedobacter sp.]|nr:hypothetical protein [Deinococcales bacterium]
MNISDFERQIQLQTLYREAALERQIPRVSLRIRLARALQGVAQWLERSPESRFERSTQA